MSEAKMVSYRRFLIICIAIGLLSQSAAWSREWHRADGTLYCEGKLLTVESGKLHVLADTGATVVIALDQLSLSDAEYVERALRSRAALLGEPVASQPVPENPFDEFAPNPKPAGVEPTDTKAKAEKSAAEAKAAFPPTNPNVTSWQGRPDPPAWDWTEPLDPQRVAKLPAVEQSADFVMPQGPSPHLAIATPRGDFRIWDRWNLTTGQRDGIVRGAPQETGRPAMSTDGKLLAAVPSHQDVAVQVWSFETGNRVGRIEVEERGYPQNTLEFVADNGLLMQARRGIPSIFDALTGKERADLRNGYIVSDTLTAVSPGQHYLAVFQQQSGRVGLLDTRNGAVAGDLIIPELNQEYTQCEAFGFSQDGARLWALIGRFRTYRLVGWKLSDASCIANLKLDTLASI
ncbi:MAG TPA: SHD1 domain-containing protein, partial [Lacipirellulaceae bacterium]|nr:SHD1 domain-containing protein [Lacipirellulaceae bacterium]